MSGIFSRYADNRSADSVSSQLRRARLQLLLDLIEQVRQPERDVTILDIGGAPEYWTQLGNLGELGIHITLLNLWRYDVDHTQIVAVEGDARDMPQYETGAFDIVHSNSVIEHVGTLADQAKMAAEVRRVGRAYYTQTPNRYFPIEPHFVLPGFQFLPTRAKLAIARRFQPGWYKTRTLEDTLYDAEHIRLMSGTEIGRLFPDAFVWRERYAGFTKSFVALKPRPVS